MESPSIDGVIGAVLQAFRSMTAPEGPGRALSAEVWADRVAQSMYAPGALPEDLYDALGEALLASTEPDAPAALAALAHVLDQPEADGLRRAHAERRADLRDDDASDLGIGRAVPVRAIEISHPHGDGVSLLVGFDQPGEPHTAGFYVDHNLGGMAKDLLVGPPLDEVEELTRADDAGMVVTPVELADVRARYDEALSLTDMTIDPPLSEDFDDTRPILERRMALLPDGGALPEPVELDDDEVEQIVADFLDSPEAEALTDEQRTEAGWLVDLWIGHATRSTIGGPYRVSPTLVEVFCVDWYPRKVVADAATAAAAPAVLPAWLRYAARVTGLDDRWRDEAIAAVADFAPAMAAGDDDPASWGLAKTALAGLDPETRDALLAAMDEDGLTIDDLDE